MGVRKHNAALERKEARKQMAFAKLNNCPTSPRKMRLVADMIRGQRVEKALFLLQYSNKEAAGRMSKLLKSAINNWEQKNESTFSPEENLIVDQVFVDSGRMLKRIQPAPQGRAHRIRKRSNHVTIVLGNQSLEA
mgnify:CR=1 FL=1